MMVFYLAVERSHMVYDGSAILSLFPVAKSDFLHHCNVFDQQPAAIRAGARSMFPYLSVLLLSSYFWEDFEAFPTKKLQIAPAKARDDWKCFQP